MSQTTTVPQKGNAKRDNWVALLLNNKALLILILLMIVSQILTGGLFLSYNNISSIVRQIAVSAMLGIGFTVVLAAGGVDLSVGHMLSFVGVVYAIFTLHMPLPLALLLAIVVGALCGLLNGTISVKLKLPPFIVTLAMAQVYRGFAFLLCDGKSVNGLSASVKYLGQGLVFGVIPISLIITIVLTVIMAVILYRMRYGRYVIATGGNAEAANVSGINVSAIQISTYVVMGICVAVGAVVLTGRVSMAAPGAGAGMEMDAIAAVVIGGTPMSGGKAKVGSTVFGCLVIGVMNNLLNLTDVSSFWQWVAKGVIIILAILIDAKTEQFFQKRLKNAA